jgi:hypothetical protein
MDVSGHSVGENRQNDAVHSQWVAKEKLEGAAVRGAGGQEGARLLRLIRRWDSLAGCGARADLGAPVRNC